MSSFQRTVCAIQHKPGVPVARGELVIDRQFALDLISWHGGKAATGVAGDTDLLLACCRLLKLDLVCIPEQETASQGNILAPPADAVEQFADHGLFVFWIVDGSFQSAMNERGMVDLMINLAQSPDEVVLELQQRSRQVAAGISHGVAAGAHGIIVADDIAYQKGPLIAPDFVERCMLPLWQEQAAAAHDLDVPVFFHSDGNVNAVLPLVMEAGFDGLQCLEPAAGMDIGAIKAKYGQALCLMGNVDPALLHASGSGPDRGEGLAELSRAVSEIMAVADGRGGLIFGSCSGLFAGMQSERVHYMYQQAANIDPAAAMGSL